MLARMLHITSANSGFTLMETLIAMLTGFVVTGALFAILQVSTTQSSRIADVAQATQLGRTTMTRIVDETHSACLSEGFAPVQEKSNAERLIFVNGYSKEAEVPSVGTTSTGVRKDEIVWSKSAQTLTDFTYLSTGTKTKEEKEEYIFATTPTPTSGVLIGEHITQNSSTTPIFQYYAYATESSTSPTAPSSTLNEKEPLTGAASAGGLTKSEAETAASVLIAFKTAPRNGKTELGRDPVMSTQATFAFEAPNSETPISAAPCE
jgi:Tfp pilus assembly protein PilV